MESLPSVTMLGGGDSLSVSQTDSQQPRLSKGNIKAGLKRQVQDRKDFREKYQFPLHSVL